MYFRLYNHCNLVEGAKCGAIYNLQSGKVLSLNQGALQLLKECQSNALEDIMDVSAPQNHTYLKFLDDLIVKKLGSLYIMEPDPNDHVQTVEPQKLDFLVLEVTSRCNNTCLHCYTTSGPCAHESSVPHECWLSVISEAHKSGASGIQIIGGEPLLYPEWRELVLKARQERFESIEIFTNATLITDSDVEFFKANNVIISTSIYAGNAEIHDKVTLNPGSFDKTMASIKKILASSIPLRIYSVIMKTNESEAENITNLCAELGLEGICPPAVRPVGRGNDEQLLPEKYTNKYIKPPFYTDQYAFAQAHCYHRTLAGNITIAYTGDAIPCIFARNHVCGSILTNSLIEILASEKLNQFWHTTKDHVEKCKDCEYRYACPDCRCCPITQQGSDAKSWPACPTGCSYNPYTGEWADEI
ncbi:radical SAM protein [Sporomusa sp.]|uniref:radical SAM protein n=1 Tax=Sporomusa sp. TaxID=2078658 RepID=UPI002B718040|nr:radical SAM protein [Sporomusa sp.]HWR44491.1 radical SAM protein [Sporomusa sp.]